MATNLATSLARLAKNSVRVLDNDAHPEIGQASVAIVFADGTKLRAGYWRLFKSGKVRISSFDHQQKYGLPALIDAKAELRKEIDNATVIAITLDKESGDLILHFADKLKLQVFNFTSYEIWEIRFPDGTVQYSNYVLSD